MESADKFKSLKRCRFEPEKEVITDTDESEEYSEQSDDGSQNVVTNERTENTRSSHPEVLCKKGVFLAISQISQENTCARVSFLMKLQASGLWWLLYNRIHDGPFRVGSPIGAGAKRSPSLKSLTHILN